ncbi:MAG: ABC transporter permease [Defluviicoccus sp.]|nr:ABC transporter permease [Defluviicoccus sp.]
MRTVLLREIDPEGKEWVRFAHAQSRFLDPDDIIVNLIALKMLFGDRGKFVGMVLGLTFAALVMTQQPSIFIGLMTRTYAAIGDVPTADVWVMDPGVQYVEESKPLRDTDLARVRGVAGVTWAVPLYKGIINAKLPDGQTKAIILTGLDDATLIGGPPALIEGRLADLRRADAIIVDREAAENRLRYVGPDGEERSLKVGDEIEINDNRATVVGIGVSTRDFILVPKAFTTYSRAIDFAPPQRRQLTYVLAKGQDGEHPSTLARRIEAQTGLKALTSPEFEQLTLDYWMTNTGIPINFGVSVLLGFLVGAAVAGQSFFNFVRENLVHYAVLKAMGLRSGILVRMVLLQALIVGAIGYGIGVGLTALFGAFMRDTVLAFRMPPALLAFAGVGVLVIVLLSALLAIRAVLRMDPAVVFRG